ncbi:NDP-n-acetyl-D-galactosaminuronic acid dehydrogenase [Fusarium mundagurra]|uniref:NDP-n-acetyl-D-galactosaminuronic acid dehydrogenase n=1 Tax=Fusarium mundagurra TaxID=1567541 RepID=A0A8H5YWC0_9HYPO|nr:NDP-n-acetyl-D-galactosaminuronic acid dehydrogenase [Fusarium mundagurra]
MAQILAESLLVQGLPFVSHEPETKSWNISSREYYDITPPSEISEAEDVFNVVSKPIDATAEPLVAVIGVGYVGEHLVDVFSKNHDVLGYDVSEARTQQLTQKQPIGSRAKFTCKPSDLAEVTHFLISVPALLIDHKTIDSSYLRSALGVVKLYGRQGAVVVVESSVAVGMTRALLGPLAKELGFFAGMSPERVDPGRTEPPAHSIPKIVSGLDDVVPGSLDAIMRLYSKSFDHVVPVSKPEVAEMMKLYENCQRMVCIAYANEMADACGAHDIDPYEVCRAAATKPFGYLPFSPGLGVGGHCIPVNPWYLLSNSKFPLLRAASEKMRDRPSEIAQRAVTRLYSIDRNGLRPRVLVVGIGFKRGQSHLANSPGLELARRLVETSKVDVAWADPLVSQNAVPQISRLDEAEWTVEALERDFDMIIVAFRQEGLDFDVLEGVQGVIVERWCA